MHWNKDFRLHWADFKGPADETSPYDACAYSGMSYRYKYTYDGAVYQVSFEVYAVFSRDKSWGKRSRECRDLLDHEQLHFDISEYISRQLKKELESHTYTDNIKNEITEIYNRYNDSLKKMQLKYDEETDHYKKSRKQKEWERFIHAELVK